MKKLIVANWKMSPISLKKAKELFSSIQLAISNKIELVICPPFIYLPVLLGSSTPARRKASYGGSSVAFGVGGQDCFWEDEGAYTGEISPLMLKNLGVKYVIVGHSERRNYMKETDGMIAKKIKSVFKNGLTPVLCVGETLEQRKNGLAKEIIKKQLEKDLSLVISHKSLVRNLIIAYEPVWAIGTGNYCQPEEALEMIKFTKDILNLNFLNPDLKVLYGGSVAAKNIAGYVKYPEIDGALVGGASLKIEEFKKIINEVSKPAKTKSTPK